MSSSLQQNQVLSPPNPLNLDIHHAQVLERLKQLRIWQKQQQDQLLIHQQLELQAQHGTQTQAQGVINPNNDEGKNEETVSTQPVDSNPRKPSGSLQPEGHTISGSSLHSNDSGMLTGQSSAVDVYKEKALQQGNKEEEDTLTDQENCHVSSGFLTPESYALSEGEDDAQLTDTTPRPSLAVPHPSTNDQCMPHDEVPVNPGIGPGSASTFEELLEKKLQQYQGHPPSSSTLPNGSSPRVFTHLPLQSCSSDDSFVVRRIERQETEEAELKEFELLEQAALDMSFSSQCSLVSRLLNKDGDTMSASSPKLLLASKDKIGGQAIGDATEKQQGSLSLNSVHETHQSVETHSHSEPHSKPPIQTHSAYSVHSNSHQSDYLFPQSGLHPQSHTPPHSHTRPHSHTQPHSHTPPRSHARPHSHFQSHFRSQIASLPYIDEEEPILEEPNSLYEESNCQTDFDDEETWDSFNDETPNNSSIVTPVIINRPDSTHGTAEDDKHTVGLMAGQQIDSHKVSQPVRKVLIVPEPTDTTTASQHRAPEHTVSSDGGRVPHEEGDHSYNHLGLPPPSALVAKLFPTLRKERETHKSKYVQSLQLPVRKSSPGIPVATPIINNHPPPGATPVINNHPLPGATPIVNNHPPPKSVTSTQQHKAPIVEESVTPFNGAASDLPQLDEQVKQKLKELESEITRFKKENTALDNLRKEREELVLKMKQEMADFERQKEQNIREFEEYKMEELKKLKKEKKVFESYQKEANAARDQKMKEELISLKQELEDLQEELRSKEARWASNVSRYRIRIDSLESQNTELQNDLKVMEEQRLLWWQQQLEAKRSPLNISRRPPGVRQSSSCSPSSQLTSSPSSIATRGNTGESSKRRRQSDPPHGTTANNRQQNKENKKPVKLRGSAPVLSKSKDIGKKPKPVTKKASSLSGTKSTLKKPPNSHPKQPAAPQNHLKPVETNVKTLTYISSSSDDEDDDDCKTVRGVASGFHGDECEIIEVRAREHHQDQSNVTVSDDDGELSDRAEGIVNQVLNDEDDTSSECEPLRRSHVVKSVRFVDGVVSSQEDPLGDLTQQGLTTPPRGGGGHDSDDVTPAIASSTDNSDSNTQQEHVEADGTRVILFPNGTKKMVSSDGQTSTVYFFNGDVKRTLSDGSVVYVYSKCQTTHKTFEDGKEIIEFSNGQTETRHVNGEKTITFPDDTVRNIYPNGEEKVVFGNGTVQYVHSNGDKTIEFTDGQREIHTKEYKRREYPDGTVKSVYPDGRQETRYANGRMKIKDKDGNVLTDTTATTFIASVS